MATRIEAVNNFIDFHIQTNSSISTRCTAWLQDSDKWGLAHNHRFRCESASCYSRLHVSASFEAGRELPSFAVEKHSPHLHSCSRGSTGGDEQDTEHDNATTNNPEQADLLAQQIMASENGQNNSK